MLSSPNKHSVPDYLNNLSDGESSWDRGTELIHKSDYNTDTYDTMTKRMFTFLASFHTHEAE